MNSKYNNRYTDKELIQIIKDFYNKNNKIPTVNDFKNRTPNNTTFYHRFGSWSKALELAGLNKEKQKSTDYTDKELLNYLLDYYIKEGKIPTTRGMISKGYPSTHTYINHFGSFKNALIKVGLYQLRNDKHQFCSTYTDEEMLMKLKDYMKDKNRIPEYTEMKNSLKNPSIGTYQTRFYSIYNALKLIGYDYEEQKEKELNELERDMINKYIDLYNKLGKVPNSRDISYYSNKDNSIYSMGAYEFHFGNLYNLQIQCGVIPTVVGRNKSKDEMINDLIMMSVELGKTPSRFDFKYFNNVASESTYRLTFGSWNNALEKARLKPNGNVYYSSKGITCLSYYELLFTNMLEEFNICFTKENMYNKFLNTNKKYRFDYVLDINNEKYFIEIFGIINNNEYLDKIKIKKELCSSNKLKLIEIYPTDFTSNKSENLYEMLLNKINIINLVAT